MPDRIVELDGVQHHFPGDATDAEIASALHGSAPKPSYGMFPTDEQKARLAPEPDWKSNLAGALEPIAHPKTAGDFTGLLVPGGAGGVTERALQAVTKLPLTRIATGVAGAAYGGVTAPDNATPWGTLRRIATYGAAGAMAPNMIKMLPASAREPVERLVTKAQEWNSPLTVAGREGRAHAAVADQVERFRPNTGGMPTSATVEPRGRVPYAPPSPSATTSTPTAAAGPLSDLELAQQEVAAGRLPASALTAIERAQTPARPPITVSPDSPLQQPRVDIGAEAVGRQSGLTKQAVREQTGPILNEAPGEASPVFPQKPFERMHDKLLELGHGNPERLNYVKSAADPKTAGLLEIMRRTLERNGLAIGGGTMAEAMRRALVGQMTGNSTAEQ